MFVNESRPLDQRVDHFVFGHDRNIATLNKQMTSFVAGGNAQVGFARLARPVDHTTHYGNL